MLMDEQKKVSPAQALPVIAELDSRIADIAGKTKEHETALQQRSPMVSDNDLVLTLSSELQKTIDDISNSREALEDQAQIESVAPELKIISEALQTKSDQPPVNLDEQQAVLEDLESKKSKLESLMANIPQGEKGEELREKSQWDLSRIKDLLEKIGNEVGSKLATLAALSALRKDTETLLENVNTRDETEEGASATVDQLKNDEKRLMEALKKAKELKIDDLEEEQLKEHNDLLSQLEKAHAIIQVNF